MRKSAETGGGRVLEKKGKQAQSKPTQHMAPSVYLFKAPHVGSNGQSGLRLLDKIRYT